MYVYMVLQIFQWLSSMPVELEGYIRPGCTILTIFIAMPTVMWVKVRLFFLPLWIKCPNFILSKSHKHYYFSTLEQLNEDPVVCIHELLSSPRNLLSGRDTFFVNLNSMIFGVMKGFFTSISSFLIFTS